MKKHRGRRPKTRPADNAQKADDDLPGNPIKRFFIGFFASGVVVFVVVTLYSDSWRDVRTTALGGAAIVGFIGGVLSTFGRKWLKGILAIAGEVIKNP